LALPAAVVAAVGVEAAAVAAAVVVLAAAVAAVEAEDDKEGRSCKISE
jgi:hypothetical protein